MLGGFHATVVGGKKILDEWHNLFDYVIEGEGEYSFPALVKSIVD